MRGQAALNPVAIRGTLVPCQSFDTRQSFSGASFGRACRRLTWAIRQDWAIGLDKGPAPAVWLAPGGGDPGLAAYRTARPWVASPGVASPLVASSWAASPALVSTALPWYRHAAARPKTCGEVAEWLNAPHSKCGIGATLSGVRISPSPPDLCSAPEVRRDQPAMDGFATSGCWMPGMQL
jgi:hypothetical protein